MLVLFDKTDVRKALSTLRKQVTARLPRHSWTFWRFTGSVRAVPVSTWSTKGQGQSFSVAIGETGCWGQNLIHRTPVLLATEAPHDRMCPVVEINVPTTRDEPYRRVMGCFARDASGTQWLCHRGTGFTSSGGRIPRDAIFEWFSDLVVEADDGDETTLMIKVAPLEAKDLVPALQAFAVAVKALKDTHLHGPLPSDSP